MLSEIILVIIFIIIGIITNQVLDYYGDKYKWYTKVTCFIAFFFPFSIIVVLPIDLASTKYRLCLENGLNCTEPLIHVPTGVLFTFWEIVYWITFNMQMFIVPLMQGYCRSGGFTVAKRLKDGLMENIMFYAMIGVPAICFLIYAVVGLRVPTSMLFDLAIPASNAYGLVLLSVFMGFGLVEIPRQLWMNSSVERKLKILYNKIPGVKEAGVDAQAEVYEIARIVALGANKISVNDSLRPALDTIMELCPLALTNRAIAIQDDDQQLFDIKYLQTLHSRIKRAHYLNKMQQAKFNIIASQAFFYQDILTNEVSESQTFVSPFWQIKSSKYKPLILKMAWWWFCRIEPIFMKVVSALCIIMTCVVLWSESTFQISNLSLSIPSLILSPRTTIFVMELLAIGFISYMCTCTYSTLLRIKIFDMYQVVPNHNTDQVSMLFVGAYLCKLTFPLCYNFLNMGGVAEGMGKGGNDYSSAPVFIQYLGPAVNLTPLFGSGYNDWVPLSVLIVCAIFFFNVHHKIFRILGFKNLIDTVESQDEGQGISIIQSARTSELRKLQREDIQPARARNTAELLARYTSKTNPRDSDNSLVKSPSRAFGSNLLGKAKKGYKKVEDE